MAARRLGGLLTVFMLLLVPVSTEDNMTMSVAVIIRPPFALHNPALEGNEAFSGFLVDIFKEVTSNLGNNYTFRKFEGQGSSQALALLTSTPADVDMVLGDIMITKERLQLVDFTVPFISMPLNVITRTREARKDVFGFLKPFAWQVWLLLFVMMAAYALFIFLVERRADSNDFPDSGWAGFRETMWHAAMVSVQDRDKPLSTAAGKLATATYGFVILIVLSAYTANLAATMSSEHIPEVVKGKSQLQTKVGAVYCGGATEQYMVKDKIMGRILCRYSDDASIAAVEEREADAAIMNKLMAHYVSSQTCNVHVVPGLELNTKPYALPVQKGWIADYAQFNRWLVELVMDGTVDRLTRKWFTGVGECKLRRENKLDYDDFYGPGILLLIGSTLAVSTAIGQYMAKRQPWKNFKKKSATK